MKLYYFLIKCTLCFLFFISCEKQEEGIVGITREETTEVEFLQIDQQDALVDILTDSSLENPWKIVLATSGQNDLTTNFSETKFTFILLSGVVLEIRAFEPGDQFFSGNGAINIFKDQNNSDLRFPFLIVTSNGQERFDPFNAPIENVGYRILKEISDTKVTLVGSSTTGDKLNIVFEKENVVVEPPVDSDFLQIDQQQQYASISNNNSLQQPWKLTQAQFGQNDITADFSESKFVFTELGENSQSIAVYEPEAFEQTELIPSITGTNEFFNDELTNDLRVQMFIGNANTSIEKFRLINDFGGLGFRVRKNISETKFTLVGTNQNGEIANLVFEKIEVPENEFLQITQLQDLKEILLNKTQEEAWKITFLRFDETDNLSNFENTEFEFFADNQSDNLLNVGVFEPEDQQNQRPSLSTEGVFTFSKDTENNDLRLIIDIETNFNELEKFLALNTLQNDKGYRIKSDVSSNKISLESVVSNGGIRTVVFEKQ